MKNKDEVTDISPSDFFDSDIDIEKHMKKLKKYFNFLEKNQIDEPKSYKRYIKREKHVEESLSKNSLCKIFCLIVKGINYNDKIARYYYENKEGKFHNPKVTAIYLRKLRDAGIIKRNKMDGRKQLYEIDWIGLFDILRFRNISEIKSSPNRPPKNSKFSQALYNFLIKYDKDVIWLPRYNTIFSPNLEKSDEDYQFKAPVKKISEKRIEEILKKFCFKILKPYVEEYVDLKFREIRIDIDEPEPYTQIKFLSNDEEEIGVDNIDFTIDTILESFDDELMDEFPKNFKEELKLHEFDERGILSDFNSFIFRILWSSDSIHSHKFQYKKSSNPNPKYVLLKSINNEFKKDRITMNDGGKP